jgi:glycosyltransferase involved in cell wall biosynthesis
LRVYFQLKHLAPNNEIHLVAISDSEVPAHDLEAVSQFCMSVQVHVLPLHKRVLQLLISPIKKLPLQVAFFYNNGVRAKIEKAIESIQPDHIHCHLIRTTEYLRNVQGIRKSLDFMDAFGKGMEKRAQLERNPLKRLLFTYEKKQLYRYEKQVLNYVDCSCIISGQDKNWMPGDTAKHIITLPNGVDFEAFYPGTFEKKYDVVFMGNLDYPPNIVAVNFLLKEIVPIVEKTWPGIKVLIAGTGASKEMKQPGSANVDFIENFGHISESIAISKIMVAPLIVHIGLPNKVLQAMAMKTPCIVSTLCNNSIGAANNKSVIEANTATEFADAIVDLLNNEAKANSIAEEAYTFVKEHYSWEKQNEIFTALILNKPKIG